jgi:tetratricopeptide (TPR) repeat protein
MRKLVWLLALLGLVAAGGGWWWWQHHNAPDRRLRRGLETARQGEWREAEKIAQGLEASGATSHAALLRAEVLFRRARRYLDRDDKPEAVPLLREVMKELHKVEDPGSFRAEGAALGGQALFHLGRLRLAEEILLGVVAERPDHVDAHRTLASLYYDQGAMVRALEHLEKVSNLDPTDGRPDRLRGLIYRDMDKPNEAVACYEEALRRPRLPPEQREAALTEWAEILVNAGTPEKASRVLARLTPEAAQKEGPTILRAECLAIEGRSDRLREVLAEGLRLHPESSRLLRLRAQLLIDENKPDKALPLLEKAVRSAPRDHACRFQLARLYRLLGRPDDAREQDRLGEESRKLMVKMNELSHRVATNPWDAPARLELADTCRKLGIAELERMWRQAAAACQLPSQPPSHP